jgi:outer membrane protein assembly factor BamB
VTVVDSTAPATLQVQDTIRFSGVFQRRAPTARLLDLRGQPLPTSAIVWRSEADSIVGVQTQGGFTLVARAEGATRVIATVARASGQPLVDTTYAVVAPVFVSMTIERSSEGVLIGEERQLTVRAADSASTFRALPDSLLRRVVWRSLSPNVATVDTTGRLRGIAAGVTLTEASLPALGLRDTMTFAVSRPYPLPGAQIAARLFAGPGFETLAATPDGGAHYAIERGPRQSQALRALTPEGAGRWERQIGFSARALSAGRDGRVYFQDGELLRGFARDGAELFPAGLPCTNAFGGYAVDDGGTIYCARADSLVAYAPTGTVRWARPAPGAQAVGVGGPDRVYAAGRGGAAYTRDGARLWESEVGGGSLFAGAVDAEGAVYFTRLDGSLGAIGPDGRLRWQVPDVRGTLAIAPGGTLLIAESGGRRMLSALRTADGVGRWRVFNDAMLSGGMPHVGADGRVYVTSACHIHVFDLASGDVLGRSPERACSESGTAFVDGRLYVATFGAIGAVTLPTRPGSEWSQLGGNAGRTRSTEPR